jgi:hypothetical protein
LLLLSQQLHLSLHCHQHHLTGLFLLGDLQPQALNFALLSLYHFLVFGLVGGECLPHFILFVLDQRLVLELKSELLVLSLLLHLLHGFLDFTLLGLDYLLKFSLCCLSFLALFQDTLLLGFEVFLKGFNFGFDLCLDSLCLVLELLQ